jgi:antitoxin (DNA-binding transcriptional repressor) of toxin-antitoxin stability system
MKVATISQTKNNLSKYLAMVKQGESIIIMDREKAVAKIEPIDNTEDFFQDNMLIALEREGIIKRSKKKPQLIKMDDIPKPGKKIVLSNILIEERELSR